MEGAAGQGPRAWWRALGGHIVPGSSLEGDVRVAGGSSASPGTGCCGQGLQSCAWGEQSLALGQSEAYPWGRAHPGTEQGLSHRQSLPGAGDSPSAAQVAIGEARRGEGSEQQDETRSLLREDGEPLSPRQ